MESTAKAHDGRKPKNGAKSRRRRPFPPPRLGWGGGECVDNTLTSNLSSNSRTQAMRNSVDVPLGSASQEAATLSSSIRGRASKAGKKRKSTDLVRLSGHSSSDLWVDKHSPKDTSSLCVAPKKVKEVRVWLEQAIDCLMVVGNDERETRMTRAAEPAGKLLILVGSPGIGKSTMVRVIAAEMGLTVHEWNDAHHNANAGTFSWNDALLSLPYKSQLESFDEFLQSSGLGLGDLSVGGVPKMNKQLEVKWPGGSFCSASLVLIEEMPNLHSAEAAAKLRFIMNRHISQSIMPTIMIFSDVCEGKHRPDDLERLIEPSMLYSPLVEIKQVHPVTKAKMKKCLGSIMEKEQLGSISDTALEELHSTSGGDLRHAIMSLQFQRGSHSKKLRKFDRTACRGDRDKRLSTFHALGKLLYAKREKAHAFNGNPLRDARPPLQFVPEDIMNESGIEQSSALSFLSYHCPEFFTDETELSEAFNRFSDAALFSDRCFDSQRDRGDSIFPTQYISSLAGRAVADANKNPAPNQFRQLNAPKIFEVMRKRRGNSVKMLQLCRRLSSDGSTLPMAATIGACDDFVMTSLPFLRTILSTEVDFALSNLHSYSRQENQPKEAPCENLIKEIEEQKRILKDDDIIDEDSVEGNTSRNDSGFKVGPGRKQPGPGSSSETILSPHSSSEDKIEVIELD